jgi:hypothetical protein
MPKFVPRPKPEPNYIPTEEDLAAEAAEQEQANPSIIQPQPPLPPKDED